MAEESTNTDNGVPLFCAGFVPGTSDLTYTSCYCEENIYKLTERLMPEAVGKGEQLYAVFLSGPRGQVRVIPFPLPFLISPITQEQTAPVFSLSNLPAPPSLPSILCAHKLLFEAFISS